MNTQFSEAAYRLAADQLPKGVSEDCREALAIAITNAISAFKDGDYGDEIADAEADEAVEGG